MAPIVQDFEANFTQYTAAVRDAQAQLKSFVVDADRVASQLGRMTDQFSGAKVLQQATMMSEAIDRIGGVSKLTAAELQRVGAVAEEALAKAAAMGVDAPAGLEKLADAARAAKTEITGAKEETGLMGDVVGEVSTKLIQMFAVEKIIEFTKSVFDAASAVEKMREQTGMSADEVQRLQYVAGQTDTSVEGLVSAAQNLTKKLGTDDGGAAKALDELSISAKAFKDASPYQQLVQVSQGLQQLPTDYDRARVANDLFGKAWKEIMPALSEDMTALAAQSQTMSSTTVSALDTFGDKLKGMKQNAVANFGETFAAMLQVGNWLKDPLNLNPGPGDLGADRARTAAAAFRDFGDAQDYAKDADKRLAEARKWGDDQLKASMEATKKAADEAKKLAAEQLNLAETYYKSIDAIREKFTGEDAITDALKYTQAFNTIGSAINQLTTKELNDFENKMLEGMTGLARTGQLTTEMGDRFAAVIVQIEQLKAAQVDTGAASAAAAAKAAEAERQWLQSMYDAAVASDAETLALQKKRDELNANAQAARDAAAAAKELAGVFAGNAVPTADSLTAAAYRPGSFLGFSPGQMVQSSISWNTPGGYYVPGRAAGGPVTAGSPYVVGESGPELFVPNSSGSIVPGGGVVVNATFHLVDTASNLAHQVSDILARSVTQARRL